MFKNIASQKVIVYAWDNVNGVEKTGDAANITARISKEGVDSAASNDVNPTEINATTHPGQYTFNMTQGETNCDLFGLSPKSTTAGIVFRPVFIYTREFGIEDLKLGIIFGLAKTGTLTTTACTTDITGFGLLGHGLEMARAGGVQFRFIFDQIPFLAGALDYAAEFIFPGGASNNRLHFEKDVSFGPNIPEDKQMLLWDPQTSGGLLLAIPANKLEIFQAECTGHGQSVWVVGRVETGNGIRVV